MLTGIIPTIRDVAAAAGVSVTTVSHVLNGKGRVRESTRELVLETAENLGYSANVQARGLANRRSMLVALQVSGYAPTTLVPASAYFHQLLDGASAEALRLGLAVVVAPAGATVEELRRLPADGAVVVDPVGSEPILLVMSERGAPVVTTGRVAGSPVSYPHVDNDHFAATRKVLDHLHRAGYERPALLTTGQPLSYARDAIQAYRAWTDSHESPEHIVTVEDATVGAAQRAIRRVLTAADAPDAVYATTDDLALGVLLAAQAAGVSIPTQLGLVGATDTAALRSASPAVTVIDLHPEMVGAAAISALVAALDEPDQPVPAIVVPTRLLSRASTRRNHGASDSAR